MDNPQQPAAQSPSSDARSISGKAFVIVFVSVSLLIAGIGTTMRLTWRPKMAAAMASASAKAEAAALKPAASAESKPKEQPK